MKILILNGPNLNLLGKRQPKIYGTDTLADIAERVDAVFGSQASLQWKQSNHEGELIDFIHEAGYGKEKMDGIVFNAGAYTHTSLALADAIAAIPIPVIEVHLSNVFSREEIRHKSLIAPVCRGSISGFGWHSYLLAVEALLMQK